MTINLSKINVYGYEFTNICNFRVNDNMYESSRYIINFLNKYKIENTNIIIKNIIKSKCNLLSSYICSDIKLEDLNLVNKYIVWLFIYDDNIDINVLDEEKITYANNIINQIEKITLNKYNYNCKDNIETPLVLKLYIDILKEIEIRDKEGYYYKKFIKNILIYLETCKKEIIITHNKKILNIYKYINLRRNNGGIPSLLILIKLFNNIKIDKSYFTMEEIKLLEKMENISNDHTSWFNDIISLKKEKDEIFVFNLVKIYKNNNNVEEKVAIEKVYNMIEEITEEFFNIKKYISNKEKFFKFITYFFNIINMIIFSKNFY